MYICYWKKQMVVKFIKVLNTYKILKEGLWKFCITKEIS